MRLQFSDRTKFLLDGVIADTEYGCIEIKDHKLYIPAANNVTYIYYTGSDTWKKKVRSVLYNFGDLPIAITYNNLIVYDNILFELLMKSQFEDYTKDEVEHIKREYYRERREIDCFPIINRGKLWYDRLTTNQIDELNDWYTKWLNVTELLYIPEKPTWLNDKLNNYIEEDIL